MHDPDSVLVSADQMQQVESALFASGMPVEALMEKVGLLLFAAVERDFPAAAYPRVGVLVGPGHNGGDALVVARELHLAGRQVTLWVPQQPGKPLTASHLAYARALGIAQASEPWPTVDLWIDGLFGFGLSRAVGEPYAGIIEQVNRDAAPVAAIDLPSGLATDSGQPLGPALRASRTYCLGLWKRGLWQDAALEWLGEVSRIDFGITARQVASLPLPGEQLLLASVARSYLPLARPPLAHKYTVGTVLAIAGSRQYLGAARLVALGARAGGPGMLHLAVPQSLASRLSDRLSEAIVLACPEAENGAIAELPVALDRFAAVVCGPGLAKASPELLVQVVRETTGALLLDADGLNLLVGRLACLADRPGPTVLTPHAGEFRRLFGDIDLSDRLVAARQAAERSGAWIVLKGARTVVAAPAGGVWVVPCGSPALARGGSGDVLSGLVGSLLAQTSDTGRAILAGVWWHAAAGAWLAERRTVLGVDPEQLAEGLIPFLAS